jgi:beta-lactamase superfamily II metal-dependent hydrolase
MTAVVKDIIASTGGRVDLLIATHEHWDHLSGFVQAKDAFSDLKVGEVWLAWTEDPKDELAQKLRSEHQALRLALASVCARLRSGQGSDSIADSMMEFFGAAGQGTTGDALKNVKSFTKDSPRFCLPKDAPVIPDGTAVRLYVLGPPHDEKMIKKYNPSKSQPETYGMAAMLKLQPALTDADAGAPFDLIAQIPLDIARQMPFFQERYWGEDSDSEEKNQSWRRIDGDWLDVSSSMALQLDSTTNNTSLVIAIELENGEVLLFAADAQMGNWLSWQDLSWTVAGKTVSGPDLLSRTILYKTGHHGSHNATLQEKGLELMKKLQIAFISVDHDMAVKKRWGKMPLDKVEARLNEITMKHVLRIDREIPTEMAGQVMQDKDKKLYYEVAV